jgi:hypothetical protein
VWAFLLVFTLIKKRKEVMRQLVAKKSGFIEPHFVPELGEEGLTAHEVAQSLGVEPEIVRRKLRRGWFETAKLLKSFIMTKVKKSNINGLEFDEFFFNTRAAKAFVGQYQNEIGLSYLEFLFGCETVVLEQVPRLKAEIERQAAEINRILLPSPRKLKMQNMVAVEQVSRDLFDNEICSWIYKSIHEVTESELLRAKQKKIEESMGGLVKSSERNNRDIAASKTQQMNEQAQRFIA